jgi:hypothetical protein
MPPAIRRQPRAVRQARERMSFCVRACKVSRVEVVAGQLVMKSNKEKAAAIMARLGTITLK